jgi:DNA polymerase I-like protein with 3'-5' exonuclease and polymerase domains
MKKRLSETREGKLRKLLSLDIETKSTTENKEDALNSHKSEITCIGVYGPGLAKVYRAPWDSFLYEVYNNDAYEFVMHNGKFDLKHMYFKFGEMPNWKERYSADTRYMAFVCTEKISEEYLAEYEAKRKELNKTRTNPHREARLHSLKTLAPYFLGVEPFWEVDNGHDDDEYVLKDCEYTYKLHAFFTKLLTTLGQFDFYNDKLMPWSKVVLQAELMGVKIDVPLIEKLQVENTEKIAQLTATLKLEWADHFAAYSQKVLKELNSQYNEMFQSYMAKHQNASLVDTQLRYVNMFERAKNKLIENRELELNLDSPAQLAWLLKDRLGLDIENLEGKESTGKEVLQKLSRENKAVGKLLELRKATKLVTAFLPKYLANRTSEDRIHCDFNIDGTRTGRLSSSGAANLQQVPRDMKHIFAADPDMTFITYDVTAVEPLLMAYYSEDAALTKLIQEGKSLHSVNAVIMFDLDCTDEEVKDKYPVQRQIAKTIGLACLYGAGWRQVQLACRKEGIFFTESQCKSIVKRIRTTYQGVWDFKQELDRVLESGEVIFNYMGRPIKIVNQEDVYMQGFNTLIQGSASDIVLDIGLEIDTQLPAIPVLFVHDSIITLTHNDNAATVDKEIQRIFKRTLTNASTSFTIQIDGGINNVWD